MNIQSALTEGLNILKSKSILSAKLDSEILMAKAFAINISESSLAERIDLLFKIFNPSVSAD